MERVQVGKYKLGVVSRREKEGQEGGLPDQMKSRKEKIQKRYAVMIRNVIFSLEKKKYLRRFITRRF